MCEKSREFEINEKRVESRISNVKVTLGICVKDSESTIRDALESILNQDYPREKMELIVVDGYSKDNTLGILKDAVRNIDVSTRIFQDNKGLGGARQIVVDNAVGEFIIWVDADLTLSCHFVANQVEFMTKNPDVGIAKGKYGTLETNSDAKLVEILEDVEFLLSTTSSGETASKALGTSGCIYRVEAIKNVGGFDIDFDGAGEDQDAEYRVRAAGWSIHITQAIFYEKRRQTWRALWNEYFWHGRGGSYLFKKNKDTINIFRFLPPVAIFLELLRVPDAYRLTKRKSTLLLPFHYIFKRIAWYLGFMEGRANLLWHGSSQKHRA